MKNPASPKVFIFAALECEAKALIYHLGLKKNTNNNAFTIYSDNKTILTITGVGKVAMAGGVAYAMALYPHLQMPVLVNIGIAGHKNQALGSLHMAAKVIDADSGKTFYPQMLKNGWPEAKEIKTMSKPCSRYNSDCLIDMEAAAFYEMAIRFSSSELIHCLKVVSDNEQSSIEKISSKIVNDWMTNQLTGIVTIIHDLTALKASVCSTELNDFDEIVQQWHFTVSGEIKLKSLLQQWQVLSTDHWLSMNTEGFSNAKGVLKKLESDVNALEVYL